MNAIQSMSNEVLEREEFNEINALNTVQNMITKAEGLKRKVSKLSLTVSKTYDFTYG